MNKPLLVAALLAVGCTPIGDKPRAADDSLDVGSKISSILETEVEIVGALAYGDPALAVSYSNPAKYRGITFLGGLGDTVWIQTRATAGTGDPIAWLVDGALTILEKNDDADGSTHDSAIYTTLPSTGMYMILVRELDLQSTVFTVELTGSGCSGGTFCDGNCVDINSNPDHCGGCGISCGVASGSSVPTCEAGVCGCSGEQPGVCGGACVDRANDIYNCGQCGHACSGSSDTSSAVCASGFCSCSGTTPSLCGGLCRDLDNDVNHCGACGNGCGAPSDTSSPQCITGSCTCSGNMPALCGGTCRDLDYDVNNCGACGNVCGGATPECSGGACVPPAMCRDLVRDGAETDVDCGGDICPACTNTKECVRNRDCTSGFCDGEIFRCDSPPPPAVMTGIVSRPEGMELSMQGTPGWKYSIEASENLTTWVRIGMVVTDTGTFKFVDSDARNHAMRFYRAATFARNLEF